MQVGKCAGSAAFWCLEGEDMDILIGHDDECWDLAFRLPATVLVEIRQSLRELAPWLSGLSLPKGYAGHDPLDYVQIYGTET